MGETSLAESGSKWGAIGAAILFAHTAFKYWVGRKQKEVQGGLSMSELKGIQNIKEVVVVGGKIFGAVAEAQKNNGKFGMEDLYLLMGLIAPAQAALADIGEVIPEAKDLSVEEMAELVGLVGAQIGGLDEKTQVKIEKVLMAIKANYEAVKAFA
jgi:hypothetical protein